MLEVTEIIENYRQLSDGEDARSLVVTLRLALSSFRDVERRNEAKGYDAQK